MLTICGPKYILSKRKLFFTSTSIQTESSKAPFLKRVDHLWTKIYSVEKKAFFTSTSIQTESSKAPFCSKSEQKMAIKTWQKFQAPIGGLLGFSTSSIHLNVYNPTEPPMVYNWRDRSKIGMIFQS